jgi:hypothetical protein
MLVSLGERVPKEFKPGWTYIMSKTLNQEIALNNRTGIIYCEDGVIYRPEEIELIDRAGMNIDPGVHEVKRLFGGQIVSSTRRPDEPCD